MLVYQRVCAGGLYHIVSTGIWPANLLFEMAMDHEDILKMDG